MSDIEALERRIRALEEVEAIKRLKYRYWRHLDLKEWDDLAACFAPDATVAYGDGQHSFRGVEAIMKFLREGLGVERGSVTIHQGHHPEIELASATTAKGTWALYNYMFNEKQNRGIRIGAYYYDDYVKIGREWKFQHIGYRTLFHEEWKRDEIASLKLVGKS
jgi:bile-acid 7alpha-dehydratase